MGTEDTSFSCNICGGRPQHTKTLSNSPRSSILTKQTKLATMRHFDDYCNCGGQQEQVCTERCRQGILETSLRLQTRTGIRDSAMLCLDMTLPTLPQPGSKMADM
ncbi:uncharacterized protein P174DRAFT_53568 [Aspergillus novofumigatus IBT 16806]|uniref:Uncharacterized protein n=1 Tax=Aspergillus novofumigatus (strain IBT 16806) TaxID=1392255 RepID=A0A2I1CPV8_ASPN1|nr:uncharacterized protein P174DRAFT_53568 [Aspergillus novofumigatus IBT 16806]PKX99657.1 hypothetical protein P174DRAFT_53568 [Aspergillus novofumigatus IBT 16806]